MKQSISSFRNNNCTLRLVSVDISNTQTYFKTMIDLCNHNNSQSKSMQFTVYTVEYTLYTVQCTVYIIQYTWYTVPNIVSRVLCTVHTITIFIKELHIKYKHITGCNIAFMCIILPYLQLFIHIYKRIKIHTYTPKYTYTYTHIFIYIYTYTYTYTYKHTHSHAQTHTHTHIHTHSYIHTHILLSHSLTTTKQK